jgi:hypothetical protein
MARLSTKKGRNTSLKENAATFGVRRRLVLTTPTWRAEAINTDIAGTAGFPEISGSQRSHPLDLVACWGLAVRQNACTLKSFHVRLVTAVPRRPNCGDLKASGHE